MPDFNVRSDSVNVEQIMEQIRTRISEKRGVDYTEQQIRDLAAVKLEKFLDPRGVRSDLLDQFRKAQPAYEPPELPNFAFEDATLFESHRAPIRWIRKLLMPLLKLLFNPNPLIQALHIQSRLNAMNAEREARRESARRAVDQLFYELVHNLVVETTRTAIEVKNLKMRIESISSRLEFNERRARALEGVVVYKASDAAEESAPQRPSAPAAQPRQQPAHQPQQRYVPPPSAAPSSPAVPAQAAATPAPGPSQGQTAAAQPQVQGTPGEGPGQRSRRRRRRRGRRGGGAASAVMGVPGTGAPDAAGGASGSPNAVESADATDAIDDDADGPFEAEEMREEAPERSHEPGPVPSHDAGLHVAPGRVEQTEAPHAEPVQAEPSHVETPRAEASHADAESAPAAEPAPTEPAPVPPVTPDRDPQ
jgi:hypothetical protein